jgi:hypothetical protein
LKSQSVSKPAPAPQVKPLSTSTEDRICYIILGLLVLLIIAIRSKFLNIPFERDEGAYTYYGKLCLEGYVPYKDFYEQKFPGLFYFYAMMVAIFGDTVKGMHIGFIILNIISVVLIFFAVRKMFSSFPAILSAITFGIVSMTPNLSGFTVQAEHGVAFFSTIGIFLYALASGNKKGYLYFCMGLALGAAFMTKTTGLFIMLWGGMIIIIDFAFRKERNWRVFFLKELLMYMGGATLIIGIMFLLVYLKGSFSDMLYWTYDIPKNYVSKVPLKDGITYFGYSRDAILNNHKLFWYHALLSLAVIFIKSISWRTKLFTVTLAAMSFLMIVPGFYFYGHYWIQLMPGLSVLAGVTFYAVLQLLQPRIKDLAKVKYYYTGAFILLTFYHLNKQKDYYFNPNYDLVLRSVYGNNPFPETMEIANYINANSKPEDQVIFMGSEPQIYFYTKKKCPTRHAYFSAVVDNVPPHKEWQREYVRDVEKAKPRYFVFARHSISLLVQPNTDNYIFEWANKYISANYNLIGVVDMPDGSVTSTYVWGKDAQTYSPKAQNVLFVFERKS